MRRATLPNVYLLSDVSRAARTAPGAIQGFIALSTPNRLRRELRETIDLYDRARQITLEEGAHADVAQAAETLARLVKKETDDLGNAVGGPLRIFHPDLRLTGLVAFTVLVLVFIDALLIRSGIGRSPWGAAAIAVITVFCLPLVAVLAMVLIEVVRGPHRTVMTVPAADVAAIFADSSGPEAAQ